MSETSRFPEETDFVSVTIKHVDYYGYVDAIDFDLRDPRIRVEFHPGYCLWFGMDEITRVHYPKPI